MRKNEDILRERLDLFDRRSGPRVGDFLQLPQIHPTLGSLTRFTHEWEDHIQTGGMDGSYYLCPTGCLDYSGGLDPGVNRPDILLDPIESRKGHIWFFDQGIAGPGRGVHFTVRMRVYALRTDARLDGIGELRCPYHLTVLDAEGHSRTCNYWYTIQKRGLPCTAFTTEEELRSWLVAKNLQLSRPLTPPGEYSSQTLAFVKP